MAKKVCVCGAAGAIGQPLCMLLACDERISTLCIQDLGLAAMPVSGIAADLSHIECVAEVKAFSTDSSKPVVEQLEECLRGSDLVIVPAGISRKPGMTKEEHLQENLDIARGIIEACAKFCPEAVVGMVVSPMNSIVPAMAELYRFRGLDPRRVLGITTLDVVRANKFAAQELGAKPTEVEVPVVGGHAGPTILPLFSQARVGEGAAKTKLSVSKVQALEKRLQEAGAEVVQKKAGAKGPRSANLSMAYAVARFSRAVLSGLCGSKAEDCALVASDVCGGRVMHFAARVAFGAKGVEEVLPLGELDAHEKKRLEDVVARMQVDVSDGIKYAVRALLREDLFMQVSEAPPDPILGTTQLYEKDGNANKINLGVGAYRTDEGKPYVLPVVLKAEQALLEETKAGKVDKEYATIDGPAKLKEVTQALVFGETAAAVKEGRVASVQSLSGTGALRVVAEFIKRQLHSARRVVYVPEPTWGNHLSIFKAAGLGVEKYPYWREESRSLDFEGLLAGLRAASVGSSVLLHACAHNPTGVDPTEEQWGQILEVCQERHLLPIIDSAYQGYASGSLDKDAFACRLFESKGVEFFVCQSFAKNLGLYGERVGMVHVTCKDADRARCVLSQLKLVIRPMYSSPPIHGAHLVLRVLSDAALLGQWKEELKAMADRILAVRAKLRKGLEDKGTPGTWSHVTDQIGMFSYTGLSEEACSLLIEKHHVYLLKSGRISLAGLNERNLEYMVNAVDDVVRSTAAKKAAEAEAKPAEAASAPAEAPADAAAPAASAPEAAAPGATAPATEAAPAEGGSAPAEESTPAGSPIKAARVLRAETPDFAKLGVFVDVEEAPADPILGTTQAYQKDECPLKVNLGVGAYRSEDGKPYVLPVVAQVEEALLNETKEGNVNKEYSTIDGPAKLKEVTQALVFGAEASSLKAGRIATAQALSGTGALRIASEFIRKHLPAACHCVLAPEPTWGNHLSIFTCAGLQSRPYPYWKQDSRSLDIEGMLGALRGAEPGSSVLLHACAHNPTGVDPTAAQWAQIVEVCLDRQLVPILDLAYQGYASGSLEQDAFACRLFESKGKPMFVCQSFAKNLGLYGERVGMVHILCKDAEGAKRVLSQLKLVIRPMYSSPPIHGAHLVSRILGDEALLSQWKAELKAMADRVLAVRDKLRKGLEEKGTPGTWNHVTDQIGMFSYTGLPKEACELLIEKHHIYLLKSGRISLAGLNEKNLGYVVNAVDDVVRATAKDGGAAAAPAAKPAATPEAPATSGAGAAAAAPTDASKKGEEAKAAAPKPEDEEEEDDMMGMDLFG